MANYSESILATGYWLLDTQRWIEIGISFLCDDVPQTYEQFKSRGVEFVAPPKVESWGTSAIFKDLDGNQFVLSSK